MATSSQGTTITAPGLSGALVTNIQVSSSAGDPLETSDLSIATGGSPTFIENPFLGANEVTVSFIGDNLPSGNGALSISGAVSASFANCLVTSSSFTGTAGELITGTATFREIS